MRVQVIKTHNEVKLDYRFLSDPVYPIQTVKTHTLLRVIGVTDVETRSLICTTTGPFPFSLLKVESLYSDSNQKTCLFNI